MSDYRIVYECSLCKRTFRVDGEINKTSGATTGNGWMASVVLEDALITQHRCSTFSIGTAKPVGIEFGPEL